jgi:hypothetical protein
MLIDFALLPLKRVCCNPYLRVGRNTLATFGICIWHVFGKLESVRGLLDKARPYT